MIMKQLTYLFVVGTLAFSWIAFWDGTLSGGIQNDWHQTVVLTREDWNVGFGGEPNHKYMRTTFHTCSLFSCTHTGGAALTHLDRWTTAEIALDIAEKEKYRAEFELDRHNSDENERKYQLARERLRFANDKYGFARTAYHGGRVVLVLGIWASFMNFVLAYKFWSDTTAGNGKVIAALFTSSVLLWFIGGLSYLAVIDGIGDYVATDVCKLPNVGLEEPAIVCRTETDHLWRYWILWAGCFMFTLLGALCALATGLWGGFSESSHLLDKSPIGSSGSSNPAAAGSYQRSPDP